MKHSHLLNLSIGSFALLLCICTFVRCAQKPTTNALREKTVVQMASASSNDNAVSGQAFLLLHKK